MFVCVAVAVAVGVGVGVWGGVSVVPAVFDAVGGSLPQSFPPELAP